MSFLASSPAQEAQRPGFQVSLGLGLDHIFATGSCEPSGQVRFPYHAALPPPCSPAADDRVIEATRRDPTPDASASLHTHPCRYRSPSICCNAWFTEGPFSSDPGPPPLKVLCPCNHPQSQTLLVSSVSPSKCLSLHTRLCPGFENPSRSSAGQK